MEENFPTVSLDDNFWMEDTCSREANVHTWKWPNMSCSLYACPYDLNQLHLTQEDLQYIDLNDIFDFPDVWKVYVVWLLCT